MSAAHVWFQPFNLWPIMPLVYFVVAETLRREQNQDSGRGDDRRQRSDDRVPREEWHVV